MQPGASLLIAGLAPKGGPGDTMGWLAGAPRLLLATGDWPINPPAPCRAAGRPARRDSPRQLEDGGGGGHGGEVVVSGLRGRGRGPGYLSSVVVRVLVMVRGNLLRWVCGEERTRPGALLSKATGGGWRRRVRSARLLSKREGALAAGKPAWCSSFVARSSIFAVAMPYT